MAKSKAKKKVKKANRSGDNFLLLHGEKFVFMAILCCAVMMITKGNGFEKFTLTPEDITESANKADDRIKKNKVAVSDVDEKLVVNDYSAFSRLIKSTLSPGMYYTGTRWEQSLFPEKIKRPDIIPLPVEQLRAESSVGAVQYKSDNRTGGPGMGGGGMSGPGGSGPGGSGPGGSGPGGMGGMGGPGMGGGMNGGDVRARKWIVVTGLIPVGKEFQEYDEKFGNAQFTDVNRDVPIYATYKIERGTKGEDGEIVWKEIDLEKVFEKEVDKWSGYGLDPVSMVHSAPIVNYNLPPLTMVCPPAVNKAYGEEVAHLPKIPLMSSENLEEQALLMKEMKELEQDQKEQQKRNFDTSDMKSFFSSNSAGRMNTGSMGGMSGGSGPGGSGPGGGMGMGGMSGPGGGSGPGMGSGGMMAGRGGMSLRRNTARTPRNLDEDYYLFRFFDFDVIPGQAYYYRVKLYLVNPNLGLEVNLVENPESVNQNLIESPYSEPSNPAALGMGTRLLAETVEPARNLWQEPKVTVSSICFNADDAQESLAQEKKLVRGQVANFMKEQHKPINTSRAAQMAPQGMNAGNKSAKNVRLTDNHISNICLLDSLGGDSVKVGNCEARRPAEVLFLDSSGIVKIRNLETDTRELNRYAEPAGGGMMNRP